MRHRWLPAAIAFLLLLNALPGNGQGGSGDRVRMRGQINGSVQFSGSAATLDSITVFLESEMGDVIQQTHVVGNGRFEFRELQRRVYVLVAKGPGVREARARVDLTLSPTQSVILTLYPPESNRTPPPPSGVGGPAVALQTLLAPENAQREFVKGEKAMKDNSAKNALKHFQKAIELYPQYYQAYQSLATVLMDQQKWAEAEQALKQSLAINDQYAPSYAALGAVYNRLGKPAQAQTALERSVQLDPRAWQAHFELAQALMAQGKVAEAEAHARRCHEMEEKFPLVHIVLGNILLRKGELKPGREEYQHFLNLAPDSPLAAAVRDKVGQIDQALARNP